MSRPLSDADTAFMPELHGTVPMAKVQNDCGWCGINLRAIPDAPKQIDPDGPYYHPIGCLAAARQAARGGRAESSGTVPVAEESPEASPLGASR